MDRVVRVRLECRFSRERELGTHLLFRTCNVSVTVYVMKPDERAKDSLEEARKGKVR